MQQALDMYLELHKWEDAIAVAELTVSQLVVMLNVHATCSCLPGSFLSP